MMIQIDDQYCDSDFFECRYQAFAEFPHLKDVAGKRIAACLTDAADWLALCWYLQQRGASAYPIHANTPLIAAKRQAQAANCHFLLFNRVGQAHPLMRALDTRDEQAVLVQMSSGTTGAPKVIERSWQAIDKELAAYNQLFTAAKGLTPVVACPITHSYGLISGILSAVKRGADVKVITGLNPKFIIKQLLTEPSLLYASPTLLNVIAQFASEHHPLSAVMTSGTILPQPWFEQLQRKSKLLFQQYGCSEAGCVALNQQVDAANQIGEVLPHLQVSAGNESQPKEIVIIDNGKQIASADLGYFDQSNKLRFVSRIDDTIIVAGLNVYPQEVEDVVLAHPQINDCVVFKRKDNQAGERVCLQVVSDDLLSFEQVRSWCQDKLAQHQIPTEISQVEQIEKLANGKVNRKRLAEQALEALV